MVDSTRERDWYAWHDGYDVPGSTLARRLTAVRERISAALDARAPGPVRAISVCAGQGRDLIGALAAHPRRADVTARLVERDPRNAELAERAAAAGGLSGVEVRVGDAALLDNYSGIAPADLVLLCGIFGNVTESDIEATVGCAGQLCATGGTVIWTRHRRPPDLVPRICDWFASHGFEQEWLSKPDESFGVGVHRFTGRPLPLATGTRMFSFVDRDRP
jgi:hypothetical protein